MILECTQALLGLISSNIQAISLEAPLHGPVEVYFALTEDDADDREVILEEFPTDLEILLSDRADINCHIWVGSDWRDGSWSGREKSLIFARRDPDFFNA